MENSSPDGVFVRKNSRLALYRRTANSEYWDQSCQRLATQKLKHILRPTKQLYTHASFFKRWIPHDGIVLEAGCGTGIWVRRLRENGWNCIGIDYAIPSLMNVKSACPELPIMGADAFNLPFSDGTLSAYLSFGVIEHFKNGPNEILAECRRVLRSGGIALISVPYENILRRRLPIVNESDAHKMGLEFFQYYFKKPDLEQELKLAGLEPTGHYHGYSVALGLDGTLSILKNWAKYLGPAQIILDYVPLVRDWFSHMIFLAAIKPD